MPPPLVYIMGKYVEAYSPFFFFFPFPPPHFKVMGVSLFSPFFPQSSWEFYFIESCLQRLELSGECQNLGLVQLLAMPTGGGASNCQRYKDSLDLPHSLKELSVLPPILIGPRFGAWIEGLRFISATSQPRLHRFRTGLA